MENMKNPDDLFAQIMKGDEKAFGVFFDETYERAEVKALGIVSNKDDAKDVVLQGYFKVWEAIKKGAKIESLAHLQNYLYVTITNTAIKFLRDKPKDSVGYESLENIPDESSQPFAEEIYQLETHAKILKLLSLLPETRYKQILQLLFIEGKTTQEIADHFQIEVNNVIKQKSMGIKKLSEAAKAFYYLCQAAMIIYFVVAFVMRWLSHL